MSSVSVPDPGEKIRLGTRIIVAPTATRAAATIAKIEVDAWAFSRITARPYSPRAGQSRESVDVAPGGGAASNEATALKSQTLA
jgi:hypothetical protein